MTLEYFSLDRRGFYKVGGTLDLFKQNPLPSPLQSVPNFVTSHDLQKHLEGLFPDGLSLHGWSYMTWVTDFCNSQGNLYANYSTTLELILEYVRKSAFADCCSRLQSYFAFTSLEEVRNFRSKQGPSANSLPIFLLHADKVMRADQGWLKLGNQSATGSYCAHKFWSGTPTPNPNWEYMLATPVHVLEQVL